MMDDRRTLILVLVMLVLGGGLVIALVYGPWALATAVPVLLFGSLLILLPYGLLTMLQKWRNQLETRDRQAAGLDAPPDDQPK
jgi:hypothetical protein